MNLKKSIERVILASALLLASAASQAAFVSHIINTTIIGGDFDGEIGKATLVFDPTSYDANTGTASVWHGISLLEGFKIFGQQFSITDADGGTPVMTFDTGLATGVLTSLDFTIFDNSPTDILEANVDFIRVADDIVHVSDSKGRKYTGTTVVPLPASAWLFASGLLGLVGMQRRRKG